MTNAEKYKSAKERAEAFFKEYCSNENHEECCHKGVRFCIECQMRWLDLEAPAEEPLPCPFCGMVCDFHSEGGGIERTVWSLKCRDPLCGYRSSLNEAKSDAVVYHNRVARAVMDAKAKEVVPNRNELKAEAKQ